MWLQVFQGRFSLVNKKNTIGTSTSTTNACYLRFYSTMNRNVEYDEISQLSGKSEKYLIDVREVDEIKETGLIPGSINIPMGNVQHELTDLNEEDFQKKYGRTKPKSDSEIIFTCRSGRRAKIIMEDVEKLGFSKAKYYLGSWLEWESKQKQ